MLIFFLALGVIGLVVALMAVYHFQKEEHPNIDKDIAKDMEEYLLWELPREWWQEHQYGNHPLDPHWPGPEFKAWNEED
jgi:hypothetical protein